MAEIQSCSRLKLYSHLKTEPGLEEYLLHIPNIKHRQSLSRLRLSSHSLNIETGRHRKAAREDRICTLCRNGIEDETHFLITCPCYKEIRAKFPDLFSSICPEDDLSKALLLLKKENLNITAKFIHEALNHRDIMLDTQSTLSNIISKIESCEEKSKKGELRLTRIENSKLSKIQKEEVRRKKGKEREWVRSLKSKFREQAKKYATLSRAERRKEVEEEKKHKMKIKVREREKLNHDIKMAKLVKMAHSLQTRVANLLS